MALTIICRYECDVCGDYFDSTIPYLYPGFMVSAPRLVGQYIPQRLTEKGEYIDEPSWRWVGSEIVCGRHRVEISRPRKQKDE